MSTLNELKKIANETPNDQELGGKIRLYLNRNKTCCSDPNNLKAFEELDSGPYGWNVTGLQCGICGKITTTNIDKS